MGRTAGDVPVATGSIMPVVGSHTCRCTGTEVGKSKVKKTPYLRLNWCTRDGQAFYDDLYVTGKALSRLNLVASRVCEIPSDTPLPDSDAEAAKALANYIVAHIQGKDAVVLVEEKDESFISESGDNIGQKVTVKRRRVAFAGYAKYEAANDVPNEAPPDALASDNVDDDTIPF